jgi:hypothetical protein
MYFSHNIYAAAYSTVTTRIPVSNDNIPFFGTNGVVKGADSWVGDKILNNPIVGAN